MLKIDKRVPAEICRALATKQRRSVDMSQNVEGLKSHGDLRRVFLEKNAGVHPEPTSYINPKLSKHQTLQSALRPPRGKASG